MTTDGFVMICGEEIGSAPPLNWDGHYLAYSIEQYVNGGLQTPRENIFGNPAWHYSSYGHFAVENTKLANATGFSGGEQFSTARDVMRMLAVAYEDSVLRPYLSEKKGTVRTVEGTKRSFTSTNKLLGTYMPILAAKTGYTREAGENLVVITEGENGEQIGAVLLGSENRFHDMKVLVEWIWRNYTWE